MRIQNEQMRLQQGCAGVELILLLKLPCITIPSLDGQKQAEERAPMKEIFLQAKVVGDLVTIGQHVDSPK